LTYITTYDTICSMKTATKHTFSYLLRNSGDVLTEVEHVDVLLDRRDGADLLLVTESREDSIRDSLDITIRALSTVFASEKLRPAAMDAFVESHPWVSWLSPADREEFIDAFILTATACRSTGGYGPLEKFLNRWKASAQIVNTPELATLLAADRGKDEAILVKRPN